MICGRALGLVSRRERCPYSGAERLGTPTGLPRKLDDAIPLRRMAKPEEIASVVAFLVGNGASYMTATTVFADGGIMQIGLGL